MEKSKNNDGGIEKFEEIEPLKNINKKVSEEKKSEIYSEIVFGVLGIEKRKIFTRGFFSGSLFSGVVTVALVFGILFQPKIFPTKEKYLDRYVIKAISSEEREELMNNQGNRNFFADSQAGGMENPRADSMSDVLNRTEAKLAVEVEKENKQYKYKDEYSYEGKEDELNVLTNRKPYKIGYKALSDSEIKDLAKSLGFSETDRSDYCDHMRKEWEGWRKEWPQDGSNLNKGVALAKETIRKPEDSGSFINENSEENKEVLNNMVDSVNTELNAELTPQPTEGKATILPHPGENEIHSADISLPPLQDFLANCENVIFYNNKTQTLTINHSGSKYYVSYYKNFGGLDENGFWKDNRPQEYHNLPESDDSIDYKFRAREFLLKSGLVSLDLLRKIELSDGWPEYICPPGEMIDYTDYSYSYDYKGRTTISKPNSCVLDNSKEWNEFWDKVGKRQAKDGNLDYTDEEEREMKRIEERGRTKTGNKPRLYSKSFSVGKIDGLDLEHSYPDLYLLVDYKGEVISFNGTAIGNLEELNLKSVSSLEILKLLQKEEMKPSMYYNYNFYQHDIFYGINTPEESKLNMGEVVTITNKINLKKAWKSTDLIYGEDGIYIVPSYVFEGEIVETINPEEDAIRNDEKKKELCKEIVSEREKNPDSFWEWNFASSGDTQTSNIENKARYTSKDFNENKCWIFENYQYYPAYYSVSVPAFPGLKIELDK